MEWFRRAFGTVAARLLLALFLPLALLSYLFAGRIEAVRMQQVDAQKAQAIAERVSVLHRAEEALREEADLVVLQLVDRALHSTTVAMDGSAIVGERTGRAERRSTTDQAMATIDPKTRAQLGITPDRLSILRTLPTSSALSWSEVDPQFLKPTHEALRNDLAQLSDLAAHLDSPELAPGEVRALDLVMQAMRATTVQQSAVTNLLLGQGSPSAAVEDLIRSGESFDRSIEAASAVSPTAAAQLGSVVDLAASRSIDEQARRLLDQRLNGDTTGSVDDISMLFLANRDRRAALDQVMSSLAAKVVNDADQVGMTSRKQTNRDLLFAAFSLAISALGTWLLSKSIVKPMTAVKDRAEKLLSGAESVPLIDEKGPNEIAVAARAINQLVGTIRVIEQQANALANGDLQDASLRERAPGRLGTSLHGTLERLTKTIQTDKSLRFQLEYAASHDRLTGLFNRAGFLDRLSVMLDPRSSTVRSDFALLFIDLDGFKQVNDNYGHASGDELLSMVASRLLRLSVNNDLVARFGGDEFVIASRTIDGGAAIPLAHAVVAALHEPYALTTGTIEIAASVGVAWKGSRTVDQWLAAADRAVYRAKASGRNRVELDGEEILPVTG